MRRRGKPIFLMHKRSDINREASGCYHVVPAGSFQPLLDKDRDHVSEFRFDFTLIREFAEELYNDNAEIIARQEESINDVLKKHPKIEK
jgi:hypothetical protein